MELILLYNCHLRQKRQNNDFASSWRLKSVEILVYLGPGLLLARTTEITLAQRLRRLWQLGKRSEAVVVTFFAVLSIACVLDNYHNACG